MRIHLRATHVTVLGLWFASFAGAACSGRDKQAQTDSTAAAASTTAAVADTATTRSLYDRLGGKAAITAVVDTFVARVAADSRINKKFARTNIPRLKTMLVDQVCAQTGGPCTYTGRSMKEAHRGMRVTEGEFNALVEDLVAALNRFNVPKREQDELVGALGSMKGDIVEVKTTATGTKLPAGFKAAAASK